MRTQVFILSIMLLFGSVLPLQAVGDEDVDGDGNDSPFLLEESDYVIDAGGSNISSADLSPLLDSLRGKRLVIENATSVELSNLDFTGVRIQVNDVSFIHLSSIIFSGSYPGILIDISDAKFLSLRNLTFSKINLTFPQYGLYKFVSVFNVSRITIQNNLVVDIFMKQLDNLFEFFYGDNLTFTDNTFEKIVNVNENGGKYNLISISKFNATDFVGNEFIDIGEDIRTFPNTNILTYIQSSKLNIRDNRWYGLNLGGTNILLLISAVSIDIVNNSMLEIKGFKFTLFSLSGEEHVDRLLFSDNTVKSIGDEDTTDIDAVVFDVRGNSSGSIQVLNNTFTDFTSVNSQIIDSIFVFNYSLIAFSKNSIKNIRSEVFLGISLNVLGHVRDIQISENSISNIFSSNSIGISTFSANITNNVIEIGGDTVTGLVILSTTYSKVINNSISVVSNSTSFTQVSAMKVLISMNSTLIAEGNHLSSDGVDITIKQISDEPHLLIFVLSDNVMIGEIMIQTDDSDFIIVVCEINTFNGYEVGCLVGKYNILFGIPISEKTQDNIIYGVIPLFLLSTAVIYYWFKKRRRNL